MDVNLQNPARHAEQGSRAAPRRAWRKVLGMFNLNDPRWGRGDDAPRNEGSKEGQEPERNEDSRTPQRPRGQGPNQGPPDLDELWRDFNRKLGGLLGKKGGGQGGGNGSGGGGMPSFNPSPKTTGIGVGLDRWRGRADLAGHRLLHRARRSAGGHHPVRQVQQHRGRRFQLASAVPDSAPRDRVCDADPLGGRGARQHRARHRSARVGHADRRTKTSSRSSLPCSTA